jgi:hypothetical protein
MRIAVLFSGRLNGYEHSYKNILDNIVQGNQVDFFISYCKNSPQELLDGFLNKFKPVAWMESDEQYFDMTSYPHPTHVGVKSRHNMMCMFLNRSNVYKLYDNYKTVNNIKYDLVCSSRLDFVIHSKLDLSMMIKSLCIPAECDYNGINDRFACGNEEVMKDYMLCYDSLQKLFDTGGTPHPETALCEYLKYKNLTPYRIKVGYSFV